MTSDLASGLLHSKPQRTTHFGKPSSEDAPSNSRCQLAGAVPSELGTMKPSPLFLIRVLSNLPSLVRCGASTRSLETFSVSCLGSCPGLYPKRLWEGRQASRSQSLDCKVLLPYTQAWATGMLLTAELG